MANFSWTNIDPINFVHDGFAITAFFIRHILFTFNIALSIMVLLVTMFTKRTLEFTAFPTILLFSILLRLSLNIASTRVILLEEHTGAATAGRVVESLAIFG